MQWLPFGVHPGYIMMAELRGSTIRHIGRLETGVRMVVRRRDMLMPGRMFIEVTALVR